MADPIHFGDPFWSPNESMSNGNAPSNYNGSDLVASPVAGIQMRIGGLGTIAARSKPTGSLKFIVRSADTKTQPTLTLEITDKSCILYKRDDDSKKDEKVPGCEFPKGEASAYLNLQSTVDPTVYWISVDRSNARLRYGQHLTNASMTYMQVLFDKKTSKWMDNLKFTDVLQDDKNVPDTDLKYNVLPITVDLPPLVVSEQEISLEELENYSRTTFINLPKGCQNLYHNIAGQNITVASASFPQLAEAIDQSCRDPKKICGKILEQKKDEFGRPEETYLRITVGDNMANSPGIPYVMEIWPPGHYSPIHDHGKACAVIKVLYGSINCTWFDAIQENREPQIIGTPVKISKGDVTWLGEQQYQVHQLRNTYKTVCITLQCYQFEAEDTVHDEFFTWLDDKLKKEDFSPNSDMAFGQFVRLMKDEWESK